MNMTILRAIKELDMDVDLEQVTVVANIERDSDEFITIYGTEENGQLYYIVLDQEVVDKISTI